MSGTWRDAFLKILHWLRSHLQEDFKWAYYGAMAAFLGLCLGLNFYLLPDQTIERWMTSRYYGKPAGFLAYFIFYGIPYLIATLMHIGFHREYALLRSLKFWGRFVLVLAILALDAGFYTHRALYTLAETPAGNYALRRIIGNLSSVLTILLPLLLVRALLDRRLESFYGLTWRNFDARPYLILLGLMVPLVLGASFTEGFLNYYPTFKLQIAARVEALPAWATVTLYESAYALDFVWEELMLRGFMVVGMVAFMGRGAVMPMVAVYCFRHFAKPFGEALSSIFGGWILGVIALRSRSLMGGVLVHIGIALMMELFAILHKL
jgi:hypothetical protein